MPAPYNYGINATPIDLSNVLVGQSVGQGIVDAGRQSALFQQAQQDRLATQQAHQLAAQHGAAQQATQVAAQQEYDADKAAAYRSRNPRDIAALAVKYPQQAENFTKALKGMAEVEQKEVIGHASSAYEAMKNARPDVAQDLLNEQAEAYESVGRVEDAKARRRIAALIDEDPELAFGQMGQFLAAALGPEAYLKTHTGLLTEDADVEKATSDAAKTAADAEIAERTAAATTENIALQQRMTRAQINKLNVDARVASDALGVSRARLALDTVKQIAELNAAAPAGSLPAAAVKERDAAVLESNAQRLAADKAAAVAARFREHAKSTSGLGLLTSPLNQGLGGSASETANEVLGSSGPRSADRQEYERIVAAKIAADNKIAGGGAMTDDDFKRLRANYTSANNDEAVAAFLEQEAAQQRTRSKANTARAEFLQANGGDLGPARQRMTVGGIVVDQGQTYAEVLEHLQETQ